MSMNKFIGIGRWAKDIDLKYTPSGKAVSSCTLAINEKYNGNDNTTFLPVVMWGKTAEVVAEHSSKGRLVAIEGRIQVRNYENNEGKKVYVTEVVVERVEFLEPKADSNRQPDRQERSKPQPTPDDDLPF